MSTLQQTILGNKNNNLSVFFTAGFPTLKSTKEILDVLNETDVDFIEIGIPFSDPLADGPVIQNSSTIALHNGMTLELLCTQLKEIKAKIKKPYLLMGYLNSLLAIGLEEFYRKCNEGGVHHIIIPDLPVNEYLAEHKPFADTFDVSPVFLITPDTSAKRILEIDKISNAFIYLVSGNTTTGNDSQMQTEAQHSGMATGHLTAISKIIATILHSYPADLHINQPECILNMSWSLIRPKHLNSMHNT